MGPALGLLAQVLPLALGAAMSPTFLAMQVVVLTSGTPGALRRGWALAAGSVTTLLVISLGGYSVLSSLPDFGTGRPSAVEAVIFALAGTALLITGAVVYRRPRDHEDSALHRVVDAGPPVLFAIGAARLAVNATTLALYIPALHLIANSTAGSWAKVLAFLLLFCLTELAVVGPVLAVTVMGARATPVLTGVHGAIQRHSRVLSVGTCVLFGLLLLAAAVRVAVQVA